MIKKTIIILILITGFSSIKINAQKPIIDSLENLIQKRIQNDTIKINLLNETAYKLYQNDVNKTLEYAKEAGKLSDKLNFPKGKSESLRLIGIYYLLRGNYAIALENFENSLKIAKKIDNKYLISKAYNNLGLIYNFYEDYSKELEYYKKALGIDLKLENKKGISICYSNIGLVYVELDNYSMALSYLEKSLKLDEELKDKAGVARVNNNIGTIYFLQKDFSVAIKYYLKALEISIKIGAISTEAEVCKDIGKLYLKQKNTKQAYYYSKKAYLLAKEIKETKLLKESSEILAKSCADLGLYKEAYNYQVIFKKMNDNLYNEENTKKIASIEFEYKYQQEKDALELEQKKNDLVRDIEKKEQRIIRNYLIFGFFSMLLFAILLFVRFQEKKKANKVLSIQKNEIEEINNELNQTNYELNTSVKIVSKQKDEIELINNNINSSINYASRIQQALLPDESLFEQNFKSHFILYKPKDIVSGDFYYFKKIKDSLIIAVADSTGHGVPGAFVSMLGIAFLNEIVRKKEITTASQILEELREQVKTTLKDNVNRDGMDIALSVINPKTRVLQFSGANNPLYIFRNKSLIQIEATKNPIGIYFQNEKAFKNNIIQLQKDDTIYMFSDGYQDQFGGKREKKFMLKRLQELLNSIQEKPLKRQKIILNQTINEWKGEKNNQTDDMLILGIKI